MTDKINRKEVVRRSGKTRSGGKRKGGGSWHATDAARFLFKAQCYDAGPDSETTCGLCGEHIRLCYVLKVLESADPFAPETGKLVMGECCFAPIRAVNQKLYRQLLAAAINLRTFMEATERDKRVFTESAPDDVNCQPVPLGLDDDLALQIFGRVIAEGGDHA